MIIVSSIVNILYLLLVKKYEKENLIFLGLFLTSVSSFIIGNITYKFNLPNLINESSAVYILYGFLCLIFSCRAFKNFKLEDTYIFLFVGTLLSINHRYVYAMGLIVVVIEQLCRDQLDNKLKKNTYNNVLIILMLYILFEKQLNIPSSSEILLFSIIILIYIFKILKEIKYTDIFILILIAGLFKEENAEFNSNFVIAFITLIYIISEFYYFIFQRWLKDKKRSKIVMFLEKIRIKSGLPLKNSFYSFNTQSRVKASRSEVLNKNFKIVYENDIREKFILLMLVILLISFFIVLKD